MNWLKFAPAALLFVIPAAGNSTPSAAATTWEMNWGDQFCTLIRRPDDGNGLILAMRVLPGSETTAILLMTQGGGTLPIGINKVAFAPSGQSFDVSGREEERAHGERVLVLYGLHRGFWDAFDTGGELQLRAGNQVRHQIRLVNTGAAERALRACASDALREWGVDEAALNALRQLPRTTNNIGLSSMDYPYSALREGRQGRVVVRVTVNADGRATACAPVSTSRFPSIDTATCDAVLRRGRFTPALDAEGRPTAATIISSGTFLIQDD
jgi:TonB family protein